MKYLYDKLTANNLERLFFLINVNGQRGYRLKGEIKATEDGYEALTELEDSLAADEVRELQEKERERIRFEVEQEHKREIMKQQKRIFDSDYHYASYY